tara:strand:- start:114 stop:239 length:126 start_codon:yes stop_codon:yes gene_type:complete
MKKPAAIQLDLRKAAKQKQKQNATSKKHEGEWFVVFNENKL